MKTPFQKTTQELASKLIEAFVQDEKPEAGGSDISAGLFGLHVSNFLRQTAALISPPEEGATVTFSEPLAMPVPSIEKDLAQTKQVLGTLITWLVRDLGEDGVRTLLDDLHKPIA